MNTPLPSYRCSRCGTVFQADKPFCGNCGADMASATMSQPTAGPGCAIEVDGGSEGSASTLAATLRQRQGAANAAYGRPESNAAGASVRGDEADSDQNGGASWKAHRERRTTGRDEWLGRVIDGRYRVIEVLGHGGMGMVYKVKHQRMGKFAAMKVLHHDLAQDEEVIGRFHREAEAVSRLTHPNTVQVFDFGRAEGALYLIMEYVRGLDLGSLIKREGPLPFARAAPIVGQICNSLAEAHAVGVVHRDLKPENILVTRTHGGKDFAKVLDFGLAKLTEREDLNEVTDRGSIVGTPYYMSPEQIRGEQEVDARSDIYSLGALMYRIITGSHAYTAKTPVGVLTKHLTAKLVLPSQRHPELRIPRRVDDLIALAMRKDVSERFPTVESLLTELEATYMEVCADSSAGLPGVLASGTGRGRMSTSAVLNDEVDYGIDSEARLQRSDIDGFERQIKRRRRIGTAVVPLVLLGIAATVAYLVSFRPQSPRLAEVEPNDGTATATPISVNTDVHGLLGRRVSTREPDRDYYRVVQAPGENTVVTVHVTGLPNIDLDLELLDRAGQSITMRDEGGHGQDEIVRRYRIREPLVVRISQAMPPGARLPVENVSDRYRLRVEFENAPASAELEPNDQARDANALRPGTTITGYLDQRADIDSFGLEADDGEYVLTIGGAPMVPILWRIGDGPTREERRATVAVRRGDTVALWRQDSELDHSEQLPGRGSAYELRLARQ